MEARRAAGRRTSQRVTVAEGRPPRGESASSTTVAPSVVGMSLAGVGPQDAEAASTTELEVALL